MADHDKSLSCDSLRDDADVPPP
uniref:Uncharacterized protein n=1 Tax=Arundo donax TaxID=35708 RepID=A0A0A8XSS5_ARUDO